MIEPFLVGIVVAASIVAGLFFLKFWRETRDSFFLCFAAFFTIEGLSRISLLFIATPHEGRPEIYLVRLFASLLILTAIIRKNFGKGS
ncbi:MAG: DUF5985 family protein [Bryobacteraceae bacterium]